MKPFITVITTFGAVVAAFYAVQYTWTMMDRIDAFVTSLKFWK